jgi:hypothetical protein
VAREHEYDAVEMQGRNRFVARCTCGWQTESYPSAGLAGAAWDVHAASCEPSVRAG